MTPGSGIRSALAVSKLDVGLCNHLIASTDGGDGFADAFIVSGSGTNTVTYTDIQTPSYAGGAYSVSSETSVLSTLTTNNVPVISGAPRDGFEALHAGGSVDPVHAGGKNRP